jgi:hypothetical protein
MHLGAAQILGRHVLTSRRLHQRRPAQEDSALATHDDAFVGHRRHIGATRGAGTHDRGNLRYALGRHPGLVEKDAAEMLAVRKHLVLVGQIGAARIHQIDARQPVLLGDLLGAQVFLDRDRIVGATLHRGVIGDDHAFVPRNPADAGDEPGRGHVAAVHAMGGELGELEEGGAGVEKVADPLARQQLAARQVLLPRRRAATLLDRLDQGAQLRDQALVRGLVSAELLGTGLDRALQKGHASSDSDLQMPKVRLRSARQQGKNHGREQPQGSRKPRLQGKIRVLRAGPAAGPIVGGSYPRERIVGLLGEITAAAELIYRHLGPTPEYCWPLICERAGTEVWVKHENHTPIGAFKVRGGLVYLDDLMTQAPETRGVIAATRGNHGQSVAYAARRAGIEAVVVVPHGNSVEKNRAMRAFGAELIEHGEDFNAALDHATELAAARDLHAFPSYHPLLVRGVATYGLELLHAVPDLDTVYVPIGLGSGINGVISARDALGLNSKPGWSGWSPNGRPPMRCPSKPDGRSRPTPATPWPTASRCASPAPRRWRRC